MTLEPDVRDYGPNDNRQYVLFKDNTPVCLACVGETQYDMDGDIGRPASLKLIWTPTNHRGNGYAPTLATAIWAKFPDLTHDGHLSTHGTKLVTKLGIPLEVGRTPQPYDDTEAEATGQSTWDKWATATPNP
ncbi:hypothetical protein OO014_03425 [Intrasporangium calvum]|uniref:N-acetyltransferase domain-containing protein n=1 Tax=Intrasporangium calvum TaxID=53358 RepID=A0ABT5GDU1_9MICO|nr:hypothetical protein [Intrasporangium calvum]MDC5696294.1 hypothetical protein [Intrasporangium calvum]